MNTPAIGLLRQLLNGRTTGKDRRVIIDLLASVDTAHLNEMLADRRLTDRLVGRVCGRRFVLRDRRELLVLLGQTRRAELDLGARAALIHALHTRPGTRGDDVIIRDLFTDVMGADLTVLKNLIDAASSRNDLEELIFREVDREVGSAILAHIQRQAEQVPNLEVKVLSDIDDTTICTLHDKRFPKGVVYPGVLALWEALDQGPNAAPRSIGDLTFVTARPAGLLGWVEGRTRTRLRGAGVSVRAMLTGSLTDVLSHLGMAAKKIENCTHYHWLFPEYRLVFIGDSGQADVMVGRRLRTEYPSVVDAVLIHDVIGTDEQTRAEYAQLGVVFFDTYVGAAVAVHEMGLISDAGLWAVAQSARQGFEEVPWRNPAQEAGTRWLLQRDLDAVGSG